MEPNKDLPRLACLQLLLQQRGRRHLVGKSKMIGFFVNQKKHSWNHRIHPINRTWNLKITRLKRNIIFQTSFLGSILIFKGVTILGPPFLCWGRTILKEGQRFAFNWILIKFRVSLHFQPLNKCLGNISQNSLGWSMFLTPMVIFLPRPRKNWAPHILSLNKNRKPTTLHPNWRKRPVPKKCFRIFQQAKRFLLPVSSKKNAANKNSRDKRYQCWYLGFLGFSVGFLMVYTQSHHMFNSFLNCIRV